MKASRGSSTGACASSSGPVYSIVGISTCLPATKQS